MTKRKSDGRRGCPHCGPMPFPISEPQPIPSGKYSGVMVDVITLPHAAGTPRLVFEMDLSNVEQRMFFHMKATPK